MIGESTGNGNAARGVRTTRSVVTQRALECGTKSAVSDPVRGRPETKPRVVRPREFDAVPPQSLRKKAVVTSRTASGNEVVYRVDSLPIVAPDGHKAHSHLALRPLPPHPPSL